LILYAGFRRVVVSPKPVAIVERREIKKLIEMDSTLIFKIDRIDRIIQILAFPVSR